MSLSQMRAEIRENNNESKSKLSRYPSFSNSNNQRSREDIYLHKLQCLIHQHTNIIKNNKPVIEHLEYQRKFYKRICQKQKEKLKGVDTNMIRKEYEEEISDLRQKRSKMHQMITDIHDEAQGKKNTFLSMMKSFEENKTFLENSLIELQKEKTEYLQIIQKKKKLVEVDNQKMVHNSNLIRQKQRTEQKYKMVKDEIQRKEVLPM